MQRYRDCARRDHAPRGRSLGTQVERRGRRAAIARNLESWRRHGAVSNAFRSARLPRAATIADPPEALG